MIHACLVVGLFNGVTHPVSQSESKWVVPSRTLTLIIVAVSVQLHLNESTRQSRQGYGMAGLLKHRSRA